ncbi:MAG: hypothetical protein ACKOXF_12050 [Chitinophagaceae bacterium]
MKAILIITLMLGVFNPLMTQNIKNKRHSITPILGIASNRSTLLTIAPNPNVKLDYLSGDNFRLPVSFRYQYQLKKSHYIGADLLGNYNPLDLHPAYNTQSLGYAGPIVVSHSGTMIGFDFHYSKTLNVKLFDIVGTAGLGGYFQSPDNTLTQDYSWYRNASPEFYNFAVAATNNSVKKFMPITVLGIGIRYKHLELGVNLQYSLQSPVKGFEYQGIFYDNNIRFTSKGSYIGYRFEF